MSLDDPGEPITVLIANILQPFSPGAIIGLMVMLVLLLCSALISGSEVAYFSLSPVDKESLSSKNTRSSNLTLTLLERPKRLLATILIANNFVNVGIVILSTFISAALFNFGNAPILGFIVQVVIVTFLILLIGEVIPKVYATKYAANLASFMAIPILILDKIFRPLSLSLIKSTSIIDKRIKTKGGDISVNELSHALELTSNKDTDKDEEKILKGIVKFGNTDVKQIMKPRLDVTAIDYKTNYSDLRTQIIEFGYSRIPVYSDSIDKLEGILCIKDLLPHLGKQDDFEWQKLIRTPFFVPENKKIDDLLKEFQAKKTHLAVVVDEYGGSSGIVTLEDVIEEIVGEITDEFDEEDLVYSKLDNLNYVFEGKTALIDFYRVLSIEGDDFEAKKGESDTLAGFVVEQAGRIPQKHERIKFNKYTFTIEAADRKRVKQLKVTIEEIQKSEPENKD